MQDPRKRKFQGSCFFLRGVLRQAFPGLARNSPCLLQYA